jgi:hypothetical protein
MAMFPCASEMGACENNLAACYRMRRSVRGATVRVCGRALATLTGAIAHLFNDVCAIHRIAPAFLRPDWHGAESSMRPADLGFQVST